MWRIYPKCVSYPIVLIGTALATLATAYFVFRENVTELKTSQELLSKATEGNSEKFATQKAEVVSLIAVLQNQKIAESERLKAYQKLNEIAPSILNNLDFEKSKTADLTGTVNEYIESLKKKIRLESNQNAYKDAFKQELDSAEKVKKAQEELNKLTTEAQKQQTGTRRPGPDGSGGSVGAALQVQNAQTRLAQALKEQKEAQKATTQVEASLAEGLTSGSKQALEAAIKKDEEQLRQLPKLSEGYKIAEDNLRQHQEQLRKLNHAPVTGPTFAERLAKANNVASLKLVKSFAKTENDLNALKKKVSESIGGAAIGSKEKQQLEQLESDINRSLGKLTPTEKKAQREAAKSGPFGSIDYYEQVAKKADEVLQKLGPNQAAEIGKQSQIKFDAEQKAEELRKQYTIKSFSEELDEKQQLYIRYQRWVESYGKDSADAQFADLKKSGDSYLDYLDRKISELDNKRVLNKGVLPEQDARNLDTLIGQRNEVTNQKSPIDAFNDALRKAQAESATLVDYLEVLKNKQAELNQKTVVSKDDFDKLKILAEETAQARATLRQQLGDYLQNVEGSEQQRLAIQKKYAGLRAALEGQYAGKIKGLAYADALASIDKGEADEVKQVKERTTQASEAFKKLDQVIVGSGREAMRKRLAELKKYLDEEKKATDTTTYKDKQNEYNSLFNSLQDDDIARLASYTDLLGNFGQALSQLDGPLGAVGGLLTGLAGNFNLLSVALKKLPENATDAQKAELQEQKIQAGLQATLNIVNDIIAAAKERKRVEAEYYQNAINQQQQYNLLLNEQIGLRTKNEDNLFGRDYLGEVKDAYGKLSDAQSKYQESLRKLVDGQAKVGLNDSINAGKALTSAVTGAVAGAALGGPVGAVIGGAVGFVAGLFGSAKEKSEEFAGLLRVYPELIQKGKNGQDELNVSLAESLIATNQVDDATKALLQTTLDWQKQIDEAKSAIHDITKDLVGGIGDKLTDVLVDAFANGTDAAIAFKATLEDVAESFIKKMIYGQTIMPFLKKFGEEVEASLGPDGDGIITDDLSRLFQKLPDAQKIANAYLQQAKDTASAYGLDIFKKTNTGSAPALSQAIQGISQESASIISGQLNAVRIGQVDGLNIMRSQLMSLSNIDRNTAQISRTNDLLESMDRRLKSIESDPIRAKGG